MLQKLAQLLNIGGTQSSTQPSPPAASHNQRVGILVLDEPLQIDILKQHTFYNILQNPLAAMVCTQLRDVFHRERADGRMKLPDAVIFPEFHEKAREALDAGKKPLPAGYCPKDGVVAILPDYRGGKEQAPVSPLTVVRGDCHKYFVGIGRKKVKTLPSVFCGSVTVAGFSFQTLPGSTAAPFDRNSPTFFDENGQFDHDANAVTICIDNDLATDHDDPDDDDGGDVDDDVVTVTIMHCEASKAENGVVIFYSRNPLMRQRVHLKDVVMKHNTNCGLEVQPGMADCLFEECVMQSNGRNVLTKVGFGQAYIDRNRALLLNQVGIAEDTENVVWEATPQFKDCVIGGAPLENFTVTPLLVETDQLDQVTFTLSGGPQDLPSNWAVHDAFDTSAPRYVLQRYFSSDECHPDNWQVMREYEDRIANEGPSPDEERMHPATTERHFEHMALKDFMIQHDCPVHQITEDGDELDEDIKPEQVERSVEIVEHSKAEGTELLKEGFLLQARNVYGHTRKWAVGKIPNGHSAFVALGNNIALCCLKLKEWEEAHLSCDEVLHLEPGNIKALHRRAQASIELGNHDEAEVDLQLVTKLAHDDEKGVARLLAICAKAKKKQKAKEKKAFGAMFA